MEVDYILRQIQKSADLPAPVKLMLEEFYQRIDEEDLLRAKEILSQLEQEIGRDSPLAVKARERLELEIALSED